MTILHGTIFSGGSHSRDKICKWFLSLKRVRTAEIHNNESLEKDVIAWTIGRNGKVKT